MKLRLKEDSKEWRKTAMLSALGCAIVSSILRWRHVFSTPVWIGALIMFAVVAATAWLQPGWYRGYYRVSSRVSFVLTQFIGFTILTLFFILILTPLGLLLRLTGKDLLRLKRSTQTVTYWNATKPSGPFDRLY